MKTKVDMQLYTETELLEMVGEYDRLQERIAHLEQQVTFLQARNTELVEENRKLKDSMVAEHRRKKGEE